MAGDLGWLQQYVEVGFFTDLRWQAWRYYELNETSYAFLWLNSIAFANLDFVREACPAAAQLVLLLRAEERLPVREAELPLLEYAARAAEAPAQMLPTWPLARGEERLKTLVLHIGAPEEYSVDMVMPYCDEPLDGLLSRSTGYDDQWLSTRVPFGHVNLILYRLEVCMPSAFDNRAPGAADATLLPPRAAAMAKYFRSVEVVPVDASPAAWEAARYLMHLVTRYDSLADFTLFVHPDVLEHVNPRSLRNLLHALRVGSFVRSGLGPAGGAGSAWHEYLSLSHHYLTRPSRTHVRSSNCTDVDLGFQELHQAVFAQETPQAGGGAARTPDPELGFGVYCCSQFLVHRDRVRRRPRAWYRRLAEAVPWEHCATSYMELLWHGIFNNGTLHEAKRQERRDLPLFLRVDNFIENASDGLV